MLIHVDAAIHTYTYTWVGEEDEKCDKRAGRGAKFYAPKSEFGDFLPASVRGYYKRFSKARIRHYIFTVSKLMHIQYTYILYTYVYIWNMEYGI